MIEWSLFDKFPRDYIFKSLSGWFDNNKSSVLPQICILNSISCSNKLSLTHCKNWEHFLSDVSYFQLLEGKLKSPINNEFDPEDSICLHNSTVFSSFAPGGLYMRVILRLTEFSSLLKTSNWVN